MTDQTALHRAHVALAAQTGRQQAALTRIGQMADYWEQQLPEVIRTPAVVAALRAALEPAAPAAGVAPAADQTVCTCQFINEPWIKMDHAKDCPAAPTPAADQTGHGCTINGQPAMPILISEYNQLVARLAEADARTTPAADQTIDTASDTAQPAADQPERRERYAAAIRAESSRVDDIAVADAVLAVADAEQAELGEQLDEAGATIAQQTVEIKRLGLMVDEYGAGATVLTDKLKRVRDLHRETCLAARGDVSPTAFKCGLCEVLDAPAARLRRMAAGAQQQGDTETEPDDTLHACPGRWGGPDCRCFDDEPAPVAQQPAADSEEETRG